MCVIRTGYMRHLARSHQTRRGSTHQSGERLSVIRMLHSGLQRLFRLFDEEARSGRASTQEECIGAASVKGLAGCLDCSSGSLFGIDGEGVGSEDLLGTLANCLQERSHTDAHEEEHATHLKLFQSLLQFDLITRNNRDVCALLCEEPCESEARTGGPASHETMLSVLVSRRKTRREDAF